MKNFIKPIFFNLIIISGFLSSCQEKIVNPNTNVEGGVQAHDNWQAPSTLD